MAVVSVWPASLRAIMPLSSLLHLALASSFIFGCVLALIGWHGRKIDDHPLCASCGFDLTGLPQRRERCPECGHELIAPTAIRIGTRAVRRRWLAVGAILLTVSVAVPMLGFWWKLHPDRVAHLEPNFLLLRTVRSGQWQCRYAWPELHRRFVARSLTDEEIRAALQSALNNQKSGYWMCAAGNLIEANRRVGKVSDADWDKYVRNAPDTYLDLHSAIARGDPLRLMTRSCARSGWPRKVTFQFRKARIEIEGHCAEFPLQMPTVVLVPNVGWGIERSQAIAIDTLTEHLDYGWHNIDITISGTVAHEFDKVERPFSIAFPLRSLLLTQNPDFAVSFSDSLELKAQMESSFCATCWTTDDGSKLAWAVSVTSPPTDGVFDVLIAMDEGEELVGRVACAQGGMRLVCGMPLDQNKLDAGRPLTILLRPNRAAALWELDTTSIWGSEIQLEASQISPPEVASERDQFGT